MLILPIDYFLLVWFVIAAASTVYVGIDQYRNNPEPTVMKWGFILVTLYMGPLGLLLYVMADKEPRPGEHSSLIERTKRSAYAFKFGELGGSRITFVPLSVIAFRNAIRFRVWRILLARVRGDAPDRGCRAHRRYASFLCRCRPQRPVSA